MVIQDIALANRSTVNSVRCSSLAAAFIAQLTSLNSAAIALMAS
ncbi:MAG: hypothetical protein WBA10_21360 [Elainellaceae cyanobacterium]